MSRAKRLKQTKQLKFLDWVRTEIYIHRRLGGKGKVVGVVGEVEKRRSLRWIRA